MQPIHPLVGRTIINVRLLEPGEVEGFDKPYLVTALDLDDGSVLVGSQDEQLSGLGEIYRLAADGSRCLRTAPLDSEVA